MSSSDSDDLEGFFASIRTKKSKGKYRLSSGSLEEFVVNDNEILLDENSGDEFDENISDSELKTIQDAVSILQLSSSSDEKEDDRISDKNEDENISVSESKSIQDAVSILQMSSSSDEKEDGRVSEKNEDEDISVSESKSIQDAVSILHLSSSSDEDGSTSGGNISLDKSQSSSLIREESFSKENDNCEDSEITTSTLFTDYDKNVSPKSDKDELANKLFDKCEKNIKEKDDSTSRKSVGTHSKVRKKNPQFNKNLDALRRRGSFTPKRSTASNSSKKSVATLKIIFSSSDSDEDDFLFSEDVVKNLDLGKGSSDSKKNCDESLSKRNTKKSSRIFLLSSDEEFTEDDTKKLDVGKDFLVSIPINDKNHTKENTTKSSRIMLLSDDENDTVFSDDVEKNLDDSPKSAENLIGSISTRMLSHSDVEINSIKNKTTLNEDSTGNQKKWHDLNENSVLSSLPQTESESKYSNLPLNSPFSFPRIKTPVTSSAKKNSRILVLSDDSDSDLDNDVIFIDEDNDKENLNDNICNSPGFEDSPTRTDSVFTPGLSFKKTHLGPKDLDSDEEYTPLASRIFGGTSNDSKKPNFKKTHPGIRNLDSDEEYAPLAARILGASTRFNDSGPPKRKISEPGFCKPLSTPSFRKPQKTCFSETPVNNKTKSVMVKSNGIPPNLPTNCNKGTAFKKQREYLTKTLYEYFNKTIFMERLSKDMIVEWDKRLTKTAGVTKCSSRTVTTVENGIRCVSKTYKATISLSEKVLDTLERLRDTLCHEMCHAAVWVLDNQNDGHGPFWKAWARKATTAHPNMPIVKRCHSYDITYKFQYQCISCRKIYGRHSKSIKVDKQACGICRGKLVLLPPTKSDGTPAKQRQPNKFAMFVKDNYKQIQQAEAFHGMTPKHSDVMKALSKQFATLSTKPV